MDHISTNVRQLKQVLDSQLPVVYFDSIESIRPYQPDIFKETQKGFFINLKVR